MGLWAGPWAGPLAQNSGGKAIPPLKTPSELFFFHLCDQLIYINQATFFILYAYIK